MSTHKEALETKTLWRGEPTFVSVSVPMKEINVGWTKLGERPIETIEFNPQKDGLSLIVNGKVCVDIILITGSATFYHISHIQKLKNMIQLFADVELPPE